TQPTVRFEQLVVRFWKRLIFLQKRGSFSSLQHGGSRVVWARTPEKRFATPDLHAPAHPAPKPLPLPPPCQSRATPRPAPPGGPPAGAGGELRPPRHPGGPAALAAGSPRQPGGPDLLWQGRPGGDARAAGGAGAGDPAHQSLRLSARQGGRGRSLHLPARAAAGARALPVPRRTGPRRRQPVPAARWGAPVAWTHAAAAHHPEPGGEPPRPLRPPRRAGRLDSRADPHPGPRQLP